MPLVNLSQLRRALAVRGLTVASVVPEASGGRREEACIRPARLVESPELAWHDPGLPEAWPGTLAFLDGVQRSELVAYAGSAPIVVGEIAAAVRERRDRRLTTVLQARAVLLIARPEAIAAAGNLVDGLRTIALPVDESPHPVRDLANAGRALDHARGELELELGERYRRQSPEWLVVDGTLTESPVRAADPRSWACPRAMLPAIRRTRPRPLLRLPQGRRSTIYAPETRSLTPVREWALRLWRWKEGCITGWCASTRGPAALDAHQPVEYILPFPRPKAKGPLADGRQTAGLGRVDRRAPTLREAEKAVEVGSVEWQGSMALGHAQHPRISGPDRALGKGPVDDQPLRRLPPVALAQLELQLATGVIERPRSIGEIADRMGRLVHRQGNGAQAIDQVPGGGDGLRSRDEEHRPRLEHRGEPAIAALTHRGGDLADHDGRRARVGDELRALDPVEKRESARPRLGRTGIMPGELGRFHQPRRPDAGLLPAAATGFRDDRSDGKPPHGEGPAQLGQIDQWHGLNVPL